MVGVLFQTLQVTLLNYNFFIGSSLYFHFFGQVTYNLVQFMDNISNTLYLILPYGIVIFCKASFSIICMLLMDILAFEDFNIVMHRFYLVFL